MFIWVYIMAVVFVNDRIEESIHLLNIKSISLVVSVSNNSH